MTAQRTLRNFPVPYPGECLYSLFSRYHARSGNVSFQDTAEDLFGNPMYEFHSSVTTPFRLEFVQRWYPQETEVFAKQLLLYHTGFQYYCLFCCPEEKSKYYDAFCQAPAKGYKRASHISREISHSFHHLRFCPLCAIEQTERYGEPYWSIIDQIDGVDFCPVHGCRLCDSPVSRNETRQKLKPAAQALTRNVLAQEQPVYASTELDKECLDFSMNVYWFLNHGNKLDYSMYNQLVSISLFDGSISKPFYNYNNLINVTKAFINQHASPALLKKLEDLYKSKYISKGQKRIDAYTFYICFLPIKVLVIQYLLGNAKNFSKAVLTDNFDDVVD